MSFIRSVHYWRFFYIIMNISLKLLFLYDLNNAHIFFSSPKFLPSQPLLLTSGLDNSLKVWIFDQSDGSARPLRSRCGHSAPPTRVRFWSRGGLGLLSSGLDHTLRQLSIMRDVQSNTEFSQGPTPPSCQRVKITSLLTGSVVKKARAKGVKVESLKLPPITDLAAGMASLTLSWE